MFDLVFDHKIITELMYETLNDRKRLADQANTKRIDNAMPKKNRPLG